MAKVHNITAVVAFAFIVILLFIIIHPIDFSNKNVEEIYHTNEGWIKFLLAGIGALISMQLFINGVFTNEMKACAVINKEKSQIITDQNVKIIKNQESYIDELRGLNSAINKNNEKDINTLSEIQKQNENIEALFRRVESNERQIKKFTETNRRLSSIEKLLKIHDKQIEKLSA